MTQFRKLIGFSALAMAIAMVPMTQSAHAALPSFSQGEIAIAARDQNVAVFLSDFFGKTNLRAKVSSSVTGKINGSWRGNPMQIWQQLSQAFNIVAYYDGGVVRVYSASEMVSRTIPTAQPADLVRQVNQMNLPDPYNVIKATRGAVVVTGVPSFIDQVTQLASGPKLNQPFPAVVTPTTPTANGANGIVSPLNTLPMPGAGVGSTSLPLRSRIIQPATARSRYEIRIFYLRYARADDTLVSNGGQQSSRPGVASILRETMGDGRPSETISSSGNRDLVRRGGGSRQLEDVDGFGAFDNRRNDSPSNEGAFPRDVNGPRISVDAANNAVIVRDRPEAMSTYEGLIAGIDIEQRTVEIEATIIELDTNRLKNLGIDFNVQTNKLGLVFGGNPVQGTTFGSDISGSYLSGAGSLFQVRINALERQGVLKVTARPRLTSLNNTEAVFDNQERFNVRVSGERDARLFEIRYGTILRVTPSVMGDNNELRTKLQVVVEQGRLNATVVDGIPGTSNSIINTEAIIRQGESLLIGGITIDSEFDFKSKTPGLGDIPVAGNLFKKRQKGGQYLERLILITPRIISNGVSGSSASVPGQSFTPVPLEQLEGKRVKTRARGGQRGGGA
jgi:type III secretion protein C